MNEFEARYAAAQPLLDAGDHAALIPILTPMAEALLADDRLAPDLTGVSVMSNLGVCLRETGDLAGADLWFKMAAEAYIDSKDLTVRYVAVQSGFLLGMLRRSQGHLSDAHREFEALTFRIMTDRHPGIRQLFEMAMIELKSLEQEIGKTAAGAPAQTEPVVTYSKRANAFESIPRSWHFEAERIICNRNGAAFAIPYDMIHELHFAYAPTRFAGSRYAMTISTSDGRTEVIDNVEFAGVGQFADRSADYQAAVATLTRRLADKGVRVAVTSGRSWAYYILMAVLTGIFLLLVLLTFLVGGVIGMLIKIVALTAMAPRLIRWFARNTPKTGTLTSLPSGSMPQG